MFSLKMCPTLENRRQTTEILEGTGSRFDDCTCTYSLEVQQTSHDVTTTHFATGTLISFRHHPAASRTAPDRLHVSRIKEKDNEIHLQ